MIDSSTGINSINTNLASTATIVSGGFNQFYGFQSNSTILNYSQQQDVDYRSPAPPADLSSTLGLAPSPNVTITASQVTQLLDRASAATTATNAIIAIVDRSGRILGVKAESGLDPAITSSTEKMFFAIDGAVAEARTAALFSNDQAPLTSRLVGDLSQTTMTQREVDSDPNSTDPTVQGPGFVAAIGIMDQFPAGILNTNQVDLFNIQASNRDTSVHPTSNGPVDLNQRFNVNTSDIPSNIPQSQYLAPMDSYGFASGLDPTSLPRGIGTLPGGIPIYINDSTGTPVLVGGIGVFFPGATGFASEENSVLSSNYEPTKPDLSMEAEYMAFAALGGAPALGPQFAVGALGGVAPVADVTIPVNSDSRIDLVGITLDIIGPGGLSGPQNLLNYVAGTFNINGGTVNGTIQPLLDPGADNKLNPAAAPGYTPNPNYPIDTTLVTSLNGTFVPEGWLVTPHDSSFAGGLTAADVTQMIEQGIQQAIQTRAAIRLPLDQNVKMTFAVTDEDGSILGLFRMPDSTVFSLDIAVGKARNDYYISNPDQVQPQDLGGFPAGTAIESRTIRFLALPRFPEGVQGSQPGPYSILNDGGTNPTTALTVGPPLPASAFQSAQGFDVFNPQTNFHDPFNQLNQNGIVFFPGGVPLYKNSLLVGGVGISGDGVDQDDVVTFATKAGFDPPSTVQTADQVFVRGIRLPYFKFNRQPSND